MSDYMSARIKSRHLFGAIKGSIVAIIAVTILIGCCLLLILAPIKCNSEVISLFVGILASVIASIVLIISAKYTRSCSTYMWILAQAEVFLSYVDTTYNNVQSNNKQYQFDLWRFVVDLREKAKELTYTEDFATLSKWFSKIIEAANKNDTANMCDAISGLNKAKDYLTEQLYL